MKRIAIPISENKLSEYFGGCSYYEIFEIENGKVHHRAMEMPDVSDISELPAWLEQKHITDVIVYKVNKNIISLFASKKVNLFVGVPQNTSDKLIDAYINGELESDKNIIKEITN
uniref:NifB/NifX family molybdenum-iron cluster-binding protein n=1 Tax=uncultured Draconibacterium sp. TaxID=1573823 RepID=UPI003216AF9A